jgi:class 3 adenylate cyclase/predicted ATPase
VVGQIQEWLASLGLSKYTEVFADNEIDFSVLPHLGEDDLRELGLPLGPRKKLLAAIAKLGVPEAVPVATDTPTRDAERRQLSVMFVDLVGSTELAGRLDPEVLREVIIAYQETCAEAVSRFEGHIAKYIGDGLLVYFGYPQAHEDDARRAVSAGLDIVEGVGNLNQQLAHGPSVELRVRVGIHTGLVVAGEMGGGETREADAIVGETPNVAARIEGLAKPNTIAISATTHALVEGLFECDDLGPQCLRGVADAVDVYRVLGESGVHSRFDAAVERGLTPLVGRDEEIGLLVKRWAQAKDGDGQVVLLSGEAGVGKSRIVHAFRDRIEGEAHSRVLYFVSPYHQNSYLYPVTEQLQRTMRFTQHDGPPERLEKLKIALQDLGVALGDTVPPLAALLSLPTDVRDKGVDLGPQELKAKTLEAVIRAISEMAAQAPVLMVVEDTHWVDPTTVELLGLAIHQLASARVLLLITFRPDFEPPWVGRGNMTQLALNRLGRTDTSALVEHVTGGMALPREVLDQIIARTDGVPIYVEELTKTLLESGLLSETDRGYALTGSLSESVIPSSLQDSLMARLDRLGPAKEVAQLAATIGRSFRHELLAAASPQRETEIAEALDKLVNASLVYRQGTGGQATYEFKHALVGDAAYGSLLKQTRQAHHRRIAEVLAQQYPAIAKTEPDILAHHYTEAGIDHLAIEYWQRAAQRAIQHSANIEAERYLGKGLEILAKLPDSPERQRREASLQNTLGVCLMPIRGFSDPEVADAFSRAALISGSIDDSRSLFVALRGLGQYQMISGDLRRAAVQTKRVMALAEGLSDHGALIEAHHLGWITRTFSGNFEAAREHANNGIALYNVDQDHELTHTYSGHDPGVCCRSFGALPFWQLGHPDQALKMCREGEALADNLAHPFSTAVALWASCVVHQLRRDTVATLKSAESLIELSDDGGFALLRAQGKMLRGCSVAAHGALSDGVSELREGIDQSRAAGSEFSLPSFYALLGHYHGQMGEAQQGLSILEEGIAMADRNGDYFNLPELHRIRGELLLDVSAANGAEAAACFRKALQTAVAQKAKLLELRACTSLAKLTVPLKESQQTIDLLTPIYSWFKEGFDTPDLRDARSVLETSK